MANEENDTPLVNDGAENVDQPERKTRDGKRRKMESFHVRRWIFTFVGLSCVGAISTPIILWNHWVGVEIAVILVGLFIWHGFYYVPIDPPTNIIPTVAGVPVNELIEWGWIWCPLRSDFTIGFISMTGEELACRFSTQEMVPGDRAVVVVPIKVYFTIDPENPSQILIVGGFPEVERRLTEQIGEVLRRWIVSKEKGPHDLDQARQMGDEAINEILENLIKGDIVHIPSEIPTEALMGFYKNRALRPKELEWKNNVFDKYPDDRKEEINAAMKKLLKFINAVRNGDQSFPLHALGIVIKRLVVDNLEPDATTKETLTTVFKAEADAEAQKITADSIVNEAKGYLNSGVAKTIDPLQATLIKRKLAGQNTQVNKIELDLSMQTLAEALFSPITRAIADKISGGKEK